MKHIIELTAKYKMGHQVFAVPMSIIGRNIVRIEKILEEVPEFTDGFLSRAQLSTGETVFLGNSYDEAVKLWHDSLEHDL